MVSVGNWIVTGTQVKANRTYTLVNHGPVSLFLTGGVEVPSGSSVSVDDTTGCWTLGDQVTVTVTEP